MVLSKFGEYIASETLSTIDPGLGDGDMMKEVDVEGLKIHVTVKR